jgi:hypothetical protein
MRPMPVSADRRVDLVQKLHATELPGMISPPRTVRRRRAIVLSLELILVVPLFLLLVFSIIEFSLLMSARTRIAAAATSGARQMSLGSGSPEQIQNDVKHLLGPELARRSRIQVDPGNHVGAVGRVTVSVPMSDASPDLLWMIGFGLSERTLEADAPMVMERAAALDPQSRL